MPEPKTSQFALLFQARFGPFFVTQFLGALNDNLYKNALLAAVTYGTLQSELPLHSFNNLSALLFILPFFLFSAWAGQLADQREKSQLIRTVKQLEVLIMTLAATALLFNLSWLLLVLLFLMGTQSALFGPVKYSLIPQHLGPRELVAGNGLVETATFLAILIGTIGAGVISQWPASNFYFAALFLLLAVAGYGFSCKIPLAPAADPALRVKFQPLRETWRTLAASRQNQQIFVIILAISWFWFLGAAYLTQIYGFAKDNLGGDQSVVIALLSLFSIGIALGSLSCRSISNWLTPTRIVLVGGIGLSLFGADMYFSASMAAGNPSELSSLMEFSQRPTAYRVFLDFLMVGAFGGLYIVPLYTLIQRLAAPSHRSRTIAAVNIVNALYMVLSAASGLLMLGVLHVTIPEFFLSLAIANLAMLAYLGRRRLFLVYTNC